MAKQRHRLSVTVDLNSVTGARPGGGTGGTVHYSTGEYADEAWCTEVRVTKKGELQLWDGHRLRVFHPLGEWVGYHVMPVTRTRDQVDADIAQESRIQRAQRGHDGGV